MLLKETVKRLENSNVFREFQKEDSDHYLAHAFCMVDKEQRDWQIGYYKKKDDKVVVFEVGEEIIKHPEEELFKKDNKAVNELDLKKVKINLEKALDIAENLKKKKYSAEIITKKIVILQHLEIQVYNLTLVTHTFNIINMKIDAISGKILHESRQSILGLKK